MCIEINTPQSFHGFRCIKIYFSAHINFCVGSAQMVKVPLLHYTYKTDNSNYLSSKSDPVGLEASFRKGISRLSSSTFLKLFNEQLKKSEGRKLLLPPFAPPPFYLLTTVSFFLSFLPLGRVSTTNFTFDRSFTGSSSIFTTCFPKSV